MDIREETKKIFDEYAGKALRAQKRADEIKAELHRSSPELKALDARLRGIGPRLFAESLKGGDDLADRLAALRKENEVLLTERAALLTRLGVPADVTDPHYECEKCRDSGYIGDKMCSCLKNRLTAARMKCSGIGGLIERQSFENFDLSLYGEQAQAMKPVFEKCRDFAETFDKTSENLLLIGFTGLGKTHLSTAIARRVIERGFDVVYDSAQNLFNDFQTEQFRHGEIGMTDKYFEADLLIIDDLGAEMSTNFTVAAFYNLLNTRINNGKSTVISTNFPPEELRRRYDDRIASRLFGEYLPYPFVGTDIRRKKLNR